MDLDKLTPIEKEEMAGRYLEIALAIRREQAGRYMAINYNLARAEKLGRLAAKILDRLDDLSANVEDNIIKTLNPKFQIAYKGKFAGTN